MDALKHCLDTLFIFVLICIVAPSSASVRRSCARARRYGSGSNQSATKSASAGIHTEASYGGVLPCAVSHIAMILLVRPRQGCV
jgi:hypothetical protein